MLVLERGYYFQKTSSGKHRNFRTEKLLNNFESTNGYAGDTRPLEVVCTKHNP